jgi:dihydroorotase
LRIPPDEDGGTVLVANGSVVTSRGICPLDILCQDGRISAFLDRASSRHAVRPDHIIDATGRLVFAGFIDPHVHSRDPGMTYKEDFAHATLGALTGGTTTVIEMPNAIPPVDSVQAFHERRLEHEKVAWVDFALWGLSTGEHNLHELGPMLRAGVAAVKLFWGYALRRDTRQLVYNAHDTPEDNLLPPPDNGIVLEVFKAIAAEGGLLAAHCEDRHITAASARALGHDIESYEDLLTARPPVAEAAAIALGSEFSKATGCRFHVVHVSSQNAVATVRAARQRGVPITAETCPHYLTLTADDYHRVGPHMKVYPPIRWQSDQDALWVGISDGTICSLGSDHAPHTVEEKTAPLSTQPAGAVGAETFGPVIIDALIRGKLSPQRFAAVMGEDTAKLYGLYPRKGVLRLGSDADLTIVDPDATWTVRNEDLIAKQPISPWNGVSLQGRVTDVLLRGRLAFHDGRPVGPSRGEFVAPTRALSMRRES